jgi:hypothetical protein
MQNTKAKSGRWMARHFWPAALVAAIALAVCPDANAQRGVGFAIGVHAADVEIHRNVRVDPQPLEDRVACEVRFLSQAGGLSDEQYKLLLEKAEAAAKRLHGLFRAPGTVRRLVRKTMVVDGRKHLVLEEVDETPDEVLRHTFMPLLMGISQAACGNVNAERERLEAFRKQASAWALVSVIDECLSLTSDQRKRLCESLLKPASDAWWRPKNPPATLDTSDKRMLDAFSGGGLGGFIVPDVDMRTVLLTAQWEVFHVLRQPCVEEVVVERRMANGAAPAAPIAQRRVLRRGPVLDNDPEWLTRCLAARVASIDAACQLTNQQLQKLLLAGKLDLEPASKNSPVHDPEQVAEKDVLVQRIAASGGPMPLPVADFDKEGSYFQKALRGRLTADQKQRLVDAERERRAFRCRARLAALVLGIERAASLSAAECAALLVLLNDTADSTDSADSPTRLLRAISRLSDDSLRTVFAEYPGASVALRVIKRQFESFDKIAENVEAQAKQKPFVLRRVRATMEDKDGKPLGEFRADEVRIDE